MSLEFRQIGDDEVGAAHDLYMGVVSWLKAKGIRQWLRPLTLQEFHDRETRGELFAAFDAGRMLATVCLAFEEDNDWAEYLGREKRWWLKTLAVARTRETRGAGRQIVRAGEAQVGQSGAKEIYLECVDSGFLPGYYGRLGYEVLKQAVITYPSGNAFPVALMRKRLPF